MVKKEEAAEPKTEVKEKTVKAKPAAKKAEVEVKEPVKKVEIETKVPAKKVAVKAEAPSKKEVAEPQTAVSRISRWNSQIWVREEVLRLLVQSVIHLLRLVDLVM